MLPSKYLIIIYYKLKSLKAVILCISGFFVARTGFEPVIPP